MGLGGGTRYGVGPPVNRIEHFVRCKTTETSDFFPLKGREIGAAGWGVSPRETLGVWAEFVPRGLFALDGSVLRGANIFET